MEEKNEEDLYIPNSLEVEESITAIDQYLTDHPKKMSINLAISVMYLYDSLIDILENLIGKDQVQSLIDREESMQKAVQIMSLVSREAQRYKDIKNER